MTFCRSFYIGPFCVSVHFLSAISVVALIMAQSPVYALLVLFCAALHELGHVVAAWWAGVEIWGIDLLPFGASLKIAGCPDYRREIVIYMGGPLFNLAGAVIFFGLFMIFPCAFLLFGAVCCVFLMLFNLVPAYGLDGGNILRCALIYGLKTKKAGRKVYFCQLFALVILSFIAARAVIFCGFNISVAAICIYLFVQTFCNFKVSGDY